MLPDRQCGFVIAEFVEHIRGVPHGDRHEFGPVLRELIRGPTVERYAHAIAEWRGDAPRMPGFARDREALAIGGRQRAAPPGPAPGEGMMVVHQGGGGRLEGVFPE